jgi:uncharacterized membrane protein
VKSEGTNGGTGGISGIIILIDLDELLARALGRRYSGGEPDETGFYS